MITLWEVYHSNKDNKQAGAELCQAQEKLGLAKLALPLIVVVFYLKK